MKKYFVLFVALLVMLPGFVFAQTGVESIEDEMSMFFDEVDTLEDDLVTLEENPSIYVEFDNFDHMYRGFDSDDFPMHSWMGVSSEGFAEGLSGAVVGVSILVVFFVLLILSLIAFWIWMLVEVIRAPLPGYVKGLWILVVLFFGLLGAFVFFLAVYVDHRTRCKDCSKKKGCDDVSASLDADAMMPASSKKTGSSAKKSSPKTKNAASSSVSKKKVAVKTKASSSASKHSKKKTPSVASKAKKAAPKKKTSPKKTKK